MTWSFATFSRVAPCRPAGSPSGALLVGASVLRGRRPQTDGTAADLVV
ncbi:hypothetical protein [Actinocorallia herbida]|nr:hypothetical protein [Actinocorallia herbida]